MLKIFFTAKNHKSAFFLFADVADSDGPVFVHINGTFFIYALANDDTFSNSHRLGLFTRMSDVAVWIESLISQ